MTVASTISRADYTGTGTVGPFPYYFRIFAATDLAVTVRDTLTGLDTVLAYPSDYAVTGVNSREGGAVTLAASISSTERLSIRRALPVLQGAALRNQGAYQPEMIEKALDKQVMILQEHRDQLGRSLKLAEVYDPEAYDLRLPTPTPGAALVWNVDGTGFDNGILDESQLSPWSAAQNQKLDTFVSGTHFTAGASTTLALTDPPGDIANVSITRRTSGAIVPVMTDEYAVDEDGVITFTAPIPAATTRVEVRYFYTYQINTALAQNVRLALGGGRLSTPLTTYLQSNAVFNVLDYGAKGDGVTDDRAAIQAAADACLAAGGGTVFFPRRDYLVGDGTILVVNGGTKSVHFRGEGIFGSCLRKGTTATGALVTWNCTDAPTSISNMGIMSQLGGNPNVDGLVTSAVMNGVYIENVWFNGLRDGCVLSGTDIYVSHCLSELNVGNGFVFDRNVSAHNCTSFRNTSGFRLTDTSGALGYPNLSTHLTACRDIESLATGVHIYARQNVELTGFQCQSSTGKPGAGFAIGAGIIVESSTRVRVSGGNIGNCGRGVQFLGICSRITIDGLEMEQLLATDAGNGYGVVLNSSCFDIDLLHLKIANTYRSAIYHGSAARVRIVGGRLRDFGTGAVANDNAGILLNGDTVSKGCEVSGVDFNSATGVPVRWLAGAQGAFVIGRNSYAGAAGNPDLTNAPAATTVLAQASGVAPNKGDADYAVTVFDNPVLRWDTALTANRTVTLPSVAAAGLRFRIVRTGLGAFTLAVGAVKTIPSGVAAFVDVEFNGASWQLAAYGTL